jgi:sRNA-binding protein
MLNTAETLATTVRWPNCFWVYEGRRKPLKIGIHVDIVQAGGFEEPALRAALRAYVRNVAYRRQLIAGAERIGLDGLPAGAAVTPEEAQHAQEANAAFFKKARKRGPRANGRTATKMAQSGTVAKTPQSGAIPAPHNAEHQPSVAAKRWPVLRLPK